MRSCLVCGALLLVRELIDPPDLPGMVSTELERNNAECRALHDGRGVFLREHPATKLRREGGD
jgi:hypothetical protein